MTTVTSYSRREPLAELREQMRRRLDAGPVVLVEDEELRAAGAREVDSAKANVSSVRDRCSLRPAYWPATCIRRARSRSMRALGDGPVARAATRSTS